MEYEINLDNPADILNECCIKAFKINKKLNPKTFRFCREKKSLDQFTASIPKLTHPLLKPTLFQLYRELTPHTFVSSTMKQIINF